MNDFLAKIGRRILFFCRIGINRILQFPDNLSVVSKIFFSHNSIFRDTFLREFYHSGIKCLPVVALTASLISVTIMRGIPYLLDVLGLNPEMLYGNLFKLVLLDISPLFAGIIVAIRASVYITMRLVQMRIGGQVDLLEILGIDSSMYLGYMTIFAGILAVPFVSLYFVFIMLIVALLYLFIGNFDITVTQFIFTIIPHFSLENLIQFFLKTMLCGGFIYSFSVYNGLRGKNSHDEIVSRTISSILFSEVAVILINVLALFFL